MAIWTGPCHAVIMSYSDPLAQKLARIAGKQAVCFTFDYNGRGADVTRLEGGNGKYVYRPLGRAIGYNPLHVMVNVVLGYCEWTDETLPAILAVIERHHTEFEHEIAVLRRIGPALDDLAATLESIRV